MIHGNPKILITYPMQFGSHTDTFKYCDHLCKRYEVTYICFDQGLERHQIDGVNVIYLNYYSGKIKRLYDYFRYIIDYSRQNNPDILFTVQFKFCFLIGLFAKSKIKILDYRSGDLSSNKYLRKIRNYILFLDTLFFRNVTVITEGVRDILHLDKARTLILPLGADVFSDNKHDFSRMDLLYVGHLHIRNIYQTVEGVSLFLEKNPEARKIVSYKIIGFGYPADEEKLVSCIEELRLDKIVKFIGRKKYTELAEFFDSSNIGVSYIPITPYYQFQPSTKTFEYTNSGLFTIATDTFENRRVISDINGVLCVDTPEGFCEALEKTYEMLPKINENNVRASLKDFLWSRIVGEILEPYMLSKLNQYECNSQARAYQRG